MVYDGICFIAFLWRFHMNMDELNPGMGISTVPSTLLDLSWVWWQTIETSDDPWRKLHQARSLLDLLSKNILLELLWKVQLLISVWSQVGRTKAMGFSTGVASAVLEPAKQKGKEHWDTPLQLVDVSIHLATLVGGSHHTYGFENSWVEEPLVRERTDGPCQRRNTVIGY